MFSTWFLFVTLVVLVIPRIISGPSRLEGQRPIMLQCQFNASTHHGVTIVVWKRNNIELHNSSLYLIVESVSPAEDHIVSTLMINSSDYYGTYTCYCYYNRSLVMSTKPITSNEISITLQSELYTAHSYTSTVKPETLTKGNFTLPSQTIHQI